jgi:hypothetical protein
MVTRFAALDKLMRSSSVVRLDVWQKYKRFIANG